MESELTEKQIIEGMLYQAQFTETLRAQIGEIKGTKVDFEGGFVHFFGQYKNCTFKLETVLESLKAVDEQIGHLKEFRTT